MNTLLRRFPPPLREVAPRAEIIVVDGGGNDGTADFYVIIADYVVDRPALDAQNPVNAGAKNCDRRHLLVCPRLIQNHARIGAGGGRSGFSPEHENYRRDSLLSSAYRSVALDLPDSRRDRKYFSGMVWCRARRPAGNFFFLPARCFFFV